MKEFAEMQFIANKRNSELLSHKVLKKRYEQGDINELMLKLPIEQYKKDYGIDISPKIVEGRNSSKTLYLNNMDLLYKSKTEGKDPYTSVLDILSEFETPKIKEETTHFSAMSDLTQDDELNDVNEPEEKIEIKENKEEKVKEEIKKDFIPALDLIKNKIEEDLKNLSVCLIDDVLDHFLKTNKNLDKNKTVLSIEDIISKHKSDWGYDKSSRMIFTSEKSG